MKRVAIISGFGWAGVSVPVAMTIEYLVSNGYFVDIYFERDQICEGLGLNQPFFEYENSQVIYFEEYHDDLFNNKNEYGIWLSQKDSAFVSFISQRGVGYDWVIGFEPHGVIRAGLYALENQIDYIYFSLEFNEKEDYLQIAEKFFAKKAQVILTQDPYRAKILADLLDIPLEKIHGVFNTTIGNVIESKSNYLREVFNISKEKIIVLAIGSLLKITGVDKILDSLSDWDQEYVLVLHGWTMDDYIRGKIDEALIKHPGCFYYSGEVLPHAKKFDIFSSADIGLIYYAPVNLNLKYAAWSSGKFYDFARCGVPVIANAIPNMRKLVEDNMCGIVLDDFKSFPSVFHNIRDRYSHYRKYCYETFKKYDFESSFGEGIKSVEGEKNADN